MTERIDLASGRRRTHAAQVELAKQRIEKALYGLSPAARKRVLERMISMRTEELTSIDKAIAELHVKREELEALLAEGEK